MEPSEQPPKRPRVIVVGLDGATFDVIRPLIEAGQLPTLARLMREGAHGNLRTTIPPVTASAWTSFMTGKNPGKHGLFDFMRRKAASYDLTPITARDRVGRTIWDLAGEAGKHSVVIGVPVTYPPSPLRGEMVADMLTPPGQRGYTYPPELVDEIEREVGEYIIYPREVYAKGREDTFLAHLHYCIAQRLKAVLHLMRTRDWDLFIVVFPETDTVQHGFTVATDPHHPSYDANQAARYGDAVNQIYQAVDVALGEIVAGLGEDDTLIVMSDHGFGPLYRFMYVNNFLAQIGMLRFKRNPVSLVKRLLFQAGLTVRAAYGIALALGLGKLRRSLDKRRTGYRLLRRFFLSFDDVDWVRTRAYAIGYIGQIFINVRGREPLGPVERGDDYERTRAEIIEALHALRDPDDSPLIEQVFLREELYSGPYLDDAPDILFFPRNLETIAFGDFEFPSNKVIEPSYAISGHHRMDGILFVHGPGVRRGVELDGARILDIAPTVLYSLGLPVPDDMDGHVLHDAYDPATFERRPVRLSLGEGGERDEAAGYSEAEQAEIEERLRSLGYLS
jgi:predicted AlkP superfamily phosphohydrolase/phosphomutase